MEIARTIAQMRTLTAEARRQGRRIGFVPTMGYLHEGHLSLVEESKRHTDWQVMSIFVNRIQFDDPNDFAKYPVDLERDFSLARDAGVDAVFVPDEGEMYRERVTYVDMDLLTVNLCGAHRPGHFRGVFTVVAKLFNIVQPDVAVFGQKDIQQAICIEKMTADLDFPIRIVVSPIVREADGLAMSSRNVRLSPDARRRAVAIYRGLRRAEELIAAGERRGEVLLSAVRESIESSNPDSIDYCSLVRYRDLALTDMVAERSVIAVAARYGGVRLIDNMIVDLDGEEARCVY